MYKNVRCIDRMRRWSCRYLPVERAEWTSSGFATKRARVWISWSYRRVNATSTSEDKTCHQTNTALHLNFQKYSLSLCGTGCLIPYYFHSLAPTMSGFRFMFAVESQLRWLLICIPIIWRTRLCVYSIQSNVCFRKRWKSSLLYLNINIGYNILIVIN